MKFLGLKLTLNDFIEVLPMVITLSFLTYYKNIKIVNVLASLAIGLMAMMFFHTNVLFSNTICALFLLLITYYVPEGFATMIPVSNQNNNTRLESALGFPADPSNNELQRRRRRKRRPRNPRPSGTTGILNLFSGFKNMDDEEGFTDDEEGFASMIPVSNQNNNRRLEPVLGFPVNPGNNVTNELLRRRRRKRKIPKPSGTTGILNLLSGFKNMDDEEGFTDDEEGYSSLINDEEEGFTNFNSVFKNISTAGYTSPGFGIGAPLVEGFEDEKKPETKSKPAPVAKKEEMAMPFKLGEIPSQVKNGPHIDASSTLMKAIQSLNPEQISAMTNDTKQLIETQKSLMGMLGTMKPMMNDGKELMETFQEMFGKQ
jgi:hypothetical protein